MLFVLYGAFVGFLCVFTLNRVPEHVLRSAMCSASTQVQGEMFRHGSKQQCVAGWVLGLNVSHMLSPVVFFLHPSRQEHTHDAHDLRLKQFFGQIFSKTNRLVWITCSLALYRESRSQKCVRHGSERLY